MNIVLLGGPGSGKGTLAKQICESQGLVSLSPGTLYREEYEKRTEFGIEAHSYWGSGGLCPDEMTNELVRMNVQSIKNCGIIFDGFPRRVTQAQYLDSICKVDLVLILETDDDIVTQRLLKRAAIEGRPDDTEDVIRNRLEVYHKNNKPIEDYYYLTPDRVEAFDASGTIEESYNLAMIGFVAHLPWPAKP